jgi:hypothetical protein
MKQATTTMSVRISTVDQLALQRFLNASRNVMQRCLVPTERGIGLLASLPEGKYPCVDTRQHAIAAAILAELGDVDTAQSLCRFLLSTQSQAGSWAHRFDLDGHEAHERVEPDTTAIVIWALLSVARLSDDQAFTELSREPIEEATRWVIDRGLNPYLYLIESRSAGADGPVSGGFDLWNNCAHAAAFAMCHRVYGGERYRRIALLVRRAIGQLMSADHRFLRGLDTNGFPDPRSDIALLAPYYFGLWAPTERTMINSTDLIEKTLWNVEIGGFARQLPFNTSQLKSPPGPQPHVTAWMACYHYEMGNTDRAEGILRWLLSSATDGELPEARIPRAAAVRYVDECRHMVTAASQSGSTEGSNRRKQLALLTERRISDLDSISAAAERRDIVDAGRPFVWAHLETLRALKRGGYLDHWKLERD